MSSRRKRPPVEDFNQSALTWLFAWLFVVAAIAGLVGEVAR